MEKLSLAQCESYLLGISSNYALAYTLVKHKCLDQRLRCKIPLTNNRETIRALIPQFEHL
jgi:hypothetical protein